MRPLEVFEHRPIAVAGSLDGLRFDYLIASDGKDWGAAFFEMHSLLERASEFRLRRFSTVGLARDSTTIFLHLAFALACMTSLLIDPRCGLRWRFCFHWPGTQARYVTPSFDGLPCVPCGFVWASSS